MKKILWNVMLIALIGFFVFSAFSTANALEIGDAAPNFTLQNPDGTSASLSDFKGKAVILNFFASWCPPCRSEIPDFIELQKQYADKGFTFVGVSLVSASETKKFVEQMGINYPVLVDNGKVSSLYGPVRSIPTTFVLDKEGKIVQKYIGARPKDVFESDINKIIR